MAIPNAILAFAVSTFFGEIDWLDYNQREASEHAQLGISVFTAVMIFILYNRSRTSYNRWWEGGTLLQKTRGEWFNAYSSIMSFTSTKPEMQLQVTEYTHLLARLFSLLMCCGLQQVSPNRDRSFEILDLDGIDPGAMEFLNQAPDKVEIILQWIQRSMVLHTQTGVIPVAPPILSRAFQEVSRGIVNLQNARKIADFPYPYPLAQISMILQLLHWVVTPFAAALAMPRGWAVIYSFVSIFVLWCIHFNALDLEFPFGNRINDLPMADFMQDWNRSIVTLLERNAVTPPKFEYDPTMHDQLCVVMSDASELYVPRVNDPKSKARATVAVIKINPRRTVGDGTCSSNEPVMGSSKSMVIRQVNSMAKTKNPGAVRVDSDHPVGASFSRPIIVAKRPSEPPQQSVPSLSSVMPGDLQAGRQILPQSADIAASPDMGDIGESSTQIAPMGSSMSSRPQSQDSAAISFSPSTENYAQGHGCSPNRVLSQL